MVQTTYIQSVITHTFTLRQVYHRFPPRGIVVDAGSAQGRARWQVEMHIEALQVPLQNKVLLGIVLEVEMFIHNFISPEDKYTPFSGYIYLFPKCFGQISLEIYTYTYIHTRADP